MLRTMLQWRRFLLYVLVTFSVGLTAFTKAYPIEELRKEAERLRSVYQSVLQEYKQSDWKPKHNEKYYYNKLHNQNEDESEEVARIMGVDEEEPEDTPGYCLNNGSSSTPTMTNEDLQNIINTVEIIFGRHSTLKTYVTVEYGSSIYSDFEPLIALFLLYGPFVNPANTEPLPQTLWMSKSPCPVCAKYMMSQYYKEATKPTIHVASLFGGDSLADSIESLKCLVKLLSQNYTVLPWDWNEFRQNLHSENCRNSIGIALENEGFTKAESDLLAVLELAQDLTALPEEVLDNWCPVMIIQ